MSEPPLEKYREHRLEGIRTFDLYPDKIVIRGLMRLGSNFESTISLSSAQPEIHRIWVRTQYFQLAAAVFLLGILFVFIATQLEKIGSVDSLLVAASYAFPLVGLIAIFLTKRKLEFVRFANNSSIALFDLARSGPDSENFDDFVNVIVKQIAASRQAALLDTAKTLSEAEKARSES